MRYVAVIGALLLPALAFGYVLISPDEVPKTYAPPVDIQSLPIDDNGTNFGARLPEDPNVTNYGEIAPPSRGEAGPDGPYTPPPIDWGNDVLVGQSGTDPTWGTLTTDCDTNGDIYVAMLDPNSGTEDTAWVWRSTNAGQSWVKIYGIRGTATYGELQDMILRVGHDANGTWLYNFLQYGAATTNGGYWCMRTRSDGTHSHMSQIRARGDSIVSVAADRNVESPEHLFAGWHSIDGMIHLCSSRDSAETWGNFRNVSSGRRYAAVCAGAAGYVYIGFVNVDSTYYRVGRYTNNLISPTSVFVNADSSGQRLFREVAIAAARTTPGSSQWARTVATYRYVPNNNIIVRHSLSTDGGVSWTPGPYPPTNITRTTWKALGPYVRYGYGTTSFRAVVTMPEDATSWDSVVYAIARQEDTWEDRDVVNDYRATGEFGAVIDFCHEIGAGGGYIAYRLYAERNVYFDGWNWTGLEDRPTGAVSPMLGSATLVGPDSRVRLHVARAGRVAVTLVDNAGRVVERLHEGVLAAGEHSFALPARLSRGVYFLRLQTDVGADVTKLVRLE